MSWLTSLFVITLIVNVSLATFGMTGDNVAANFFETGDDNQVVGVKDETIGAISPQNFTASSANTGNPQNTDFRLIDTLGAVRNVFELIGQVLFAPLAMSFHLNMPVWFVSMIAVPWTLAFWVSLAMAIRGVGD